MRKMLGRFLIIIVSTSGLCARVSAGEKTLAELVDASLTAIHERDWGKSLALSEETVARYGKDRPLEKYGPQFGAIYYRKGFAEMKLKKWAEAMASFEVCYRDFPNKTATAQNDNNFQTLALLKWGEAAMGSAQWEVALRQFEKFTTERDRSRDFFAQGLYHINSAVCHAKLGNIPQAIEHLEIAMKNRLPFATPEEGIIAAFEALASAAISAGNEQALLDCIEKNRGELTVSPALMYRYSRVFLKLAGEAISANLLRAALVLYPFVPDTAIALEDACAHPDVLTPAEVLALKSDLTRVDSPDIIKLTATAVLHQKIGNSGGVLAAQHALEKYQLDTSKRENSLPDLAKRSPVAVQSMEEVRQNFEARRYQEALAAIMMLKQKPIDPSLAALASFYQLECLRKLGDFTALAEALKTFEPSMLSRRSQRQEVRLYQLCELARRENWQVLDARATSLADENLSQSQQAQTAYFHGLALEGLGRIPAAMMAYQTTLTADAAASEDIVRLATLRLLALYHEDPDVQVTLKNLGTPFAEPSSSLGARSLREAGALAAFFRLSSGGSGALPEEFEVYLGHALGE